MGDEKKNQKNNDPTHNNWWSRCRKGMSKIWDHAQQYSTEYLLHVRRLQQISKIAGWTFVGAGTFGMPGAATASVVCFAVSQGLKMVADQARDVKEIADDLEAQDFEHEAETRMDSNEDRIRDLEAVVMEQREIIEEQMKSGEIMQESHTQMTGALQNSDSQIQKLQESHDKLRQALKMMLEAEQADEGDARSEHRIKYARELGDAVDKGLIEYVDYDPESDDLVRFTEDQQVELQAEEDAPTMH
ncbi:hypothetical protein, partial [Pseudoalteromonas sp. GABNS16H]|uniref:hypothetical protein n=1 Tax=Pseudoalteromonas sp. GABNS16H TaxID=3025325 RepID=UPI002361C916